MRKAFVFLISFTVLLATSSASAETSYRYWSYWLQNDGVWISANAGAAAVPVVDGSVQGWRFVETGAALNESAEPSIRPTFLDICGDGETSTDNVRIGLVIDYGTSADNGNTDTPPQVETHCVEISAASSSMQALAQVVDIREEAGFVCALNSYPETGCGEAVVTSSNPETTNDESTSADPASLLPLLTLAFLSIGFLWLMKVRGKTE
jgi:hypothetical protein